MKKDYKIDLLKGDLKKNIIRLGTPIAIGSAVQMLYNLADTYWLGRLGRSAISAPVISFFILFLLIGLGIGFSIAGTSLVSQYIGAGEKDKASRVSGNLLFIMGSLSVVSVALLLPFTEEIFRLLKTPGDTFAQTVSYFKISLAGMPLAFPFFVFYSVFNGYGDTKTPLMIELISATINIVLDPILIFGHFGLPALGVDGAAIVTVGSRAIASAAGLYILFSGRRGFKIDLKMLIPDKKLTRLIMKTGIPAALGMAGASLGFIVLIGFVNQFGTAVVSAYGIMSRIVHLYAMPAMAIASAVTAIVGQSLGAGDVERASKAVKTGGKLMLIILTPFIVLSTFYGEYFTKFFIPGDQLVNSISSSMFLIISPSVLFFGLGSVLNGAFQGSGYTVPIMVSNILRVWAFRIPSVYILSFIILGGPGNKGAHIGIWWGMFISNIFAFIIIYFWYISGRWKKARISADVPEKEIGNG
ncbi:MAG: MATE family efflux transporter [Acidobacteriota bacterium]